MEDMQLRRAIPSNEAVRPQQPLCCPSAAAALLSVRSTGGETSVAAQPTPPVTNGHPLPVTCESESRRAHPPVEPVHCTFQLGACP